MQLPEAYPETLQDMAACLNEQLQACHAPGEAAALALALVEALRARFGGSLIYFPKGEAFDRARRDRALLAAFDGRNHRDLARRFGIGLAAVYDIIARAKDANRFKK